LTAEFAEDAEDNGKAGESRGKKQQEKVGGGLAFLPFLLPRFSSVSSFSASSANSAVKNSRLLDRGERSPDEMGIATFRLRPDKVGKRVSAESLATLAVKDFSERRHACGIS
jgi:hypothetical protein